LLKPPLAELGMLGRLARDLPGFLRTPTTLEQAELTVKRLLETRSERFLCTVDWAIYSRPHSPYLRLLRAAGCEPGDLRALAAREGVEGALGRLAEQGVYVSFEEFKGGREIVRGSERFAPAEQDFNNPRAAPHVELRTGGTRSPGTSVWISLGFVADMAVHDAVALQAHGLADADHVIWMSAPLFQLLRYARVGYPVAAWFYPLAPLPWKVRAAAAYLKTLGRLVGYRLPEPVWNDLQEPERIAAWLGNRTATARPVCLTTFASSAVRVAVAAREQGLSLEGVYFITAGEPMTESRLRALRVVGAGALVRYGFFEAGPVGYSCAKGRGSDDLHFFSDSFALIQQPRVVDHSGFSTQAFLFTSLLPSAPKILLNVENGDHGMIERRECSCPLGALGLREHLSEIRSHEKLTGEGMTFVRTNLLRVLEEVLPERFGGSSVDYQVVEEEAPDGILRLGLLVSPRLEAVDEAQLKQTFLAELGRGGELEGHMARMWERAGTVEVRRQAPLATRAGKVFPFHLAKERPS
jgi:hypothetical protein